MIAEPILFTIFGMALTILIIGLLLKIFNQPHVITYILAGVILGPSFLGLVSDQTLLQSIGSIGIVLLMFFVGMEISIPKLVSNWKMIIIGPILQVIVASISMIIFGKFLGWSFGKSILMAFVITISSTAVVVKILKSWEELHTKIGQDVLGILIVQDLMVVPMIIILGLANSQKVDVAKTFESIIFGIIVITIFVYLVKKQKLKIPFHHHIKEDSELRFFLALIVCFGFAILTSYLGLSSALGAFIAGLLMSEEAHNYSMKKNLKPFYFFFMAIFFMSIGMMLDFNFLKENFAILLFLLILVFVLSTIMNMLIIRVLGSTWKESLYAGALLSQLGEFGYVLAAIGLTSGIIVGEGYTLIITLISLTLIFSPFWIGLIKSALKIENYKLEIPKNLSIKNLEELYPKTPEGLKRFYDHMKKKIK